MKVDTQSSNSSKKKLPLTIGELSKETEHEQTVHVTIQYRFIKNMIFQTTPVVLKKGNQKVVVNALIDDGSTKTYVNEDVATELKLKGPVE